MTPMSYYRLEADDEAAGGGRGAVTSQQEPEILTCCVSLPSRRTNKRRVISVRHRGASNYVTETMCTPVHGSEWNLSE